MIIEFPKRYTVKHITGNLFHIAIPAEFLAPLTELLKAQAWIDSVYVEKELHVFCSHAYEYTQGEVHTALCKLAEHILEPAVEVDRDVWDFSESDA